MCARVWVGRRWVDVMYPFHYVLNSYDVSIFLCLPLSATHLYSILFLALTHPLTHTFRLSVPRSRSYALACSLRRLALALILHLPDVVATMPTLFLFFVPRFFSFCLACISCVCVCVCALAADDFFPLLSFPASFVLYGFPERETFYTHVYKKKKK